MNARAAVTSREAYEQACDRHDAAAAAVTAAAERLTRARLDLEDASDQLAAHEAYPGIPLYNRCPTCASREGNPFSVWPPAGHDGPCES